MDLLGPNQLQKLAKELLLTDVAIAVKVAPNRSLTEILKAKRKLSCLALYATSA